MISPQLVIVDMDGTVVRHSTSRVAPTPAILDALSKVRAAGVPVAAATGRALWDGLTTAAALGMHDGLISTTHGAVTYDLASRQAVDTVDMDPALAVKRFTAADASVAFAVEIDDTGWYHTSDFARNFESHWSQVMELDALAARRVTRLVARLPGFAYGAGNRSPESVHLMNAAGLDESQYYVVPGYNGWIDVGPAGVTKATGAAAIARYYGVAPENTVVFGDAGNDLPMFAWAGHAVAMGQAADEVKAAADEVAPSVDDDGVATVLRRWFP